MGSFEESLPAALLALETLDSDGDGASNVLEIAAGSNPGDASETWLYCPPQLPSSGVAPVPVGYDFDVAPRRVSILYCGRSPTYEEYESFIKELRMRACSTIDCPTPFVPVSTVSFGGTEYFID